MPHPPRRHRVAIVGGGIAALTAAVELSQPGLADQYDITVYQMGWRLGGKGASGRGPSDRIEEHGLHLWMGFYENAFGLMRACYAERQAAFPECRFSSWRDAFKPAPDVAVADRIGAADAAWSFWRAHFKPGKGEPGDPLTQGSPFTVESYLRQAVLLVVELIRSAGEREAGAGPASPQRSGAQGVASAIDHLLGYGQLATLAAVFEATDLLHQVMDGFLPQTLREFSQPLTRLIDALAQTARQRIDRLADGDLELRRVWQVIDIILAIVRGATLEGLAFDPRGFDAINDHDWRDWLRTHGAAESSLQSGFMRGIYDLAFAYEDGDVERPRLAAGVALRGAMRMFFTYRGSLFYAMSAGMGDVVFAPIYQVLKRRGVRFEFFHRLQSMQVSPPESGVTPHISSLTFDVQARIVGGGEYQPLVDVRGVPSWPAQPDLSQLEGGQDPSKGLSEARFEAEWDTTRAAQLKLAVQRDFDFVVLGIPVAALPAVAGELIEREPRWRDMVERVRTVPTQALQLWLNQDTTQLGWPHGPVNLSGFTEPFDTWADMRHLIPEESFGGRAKAVAYFCSVLPDTRPAQATTHAEQRQFHLEQRALVRDNAISFLDHDVGALWPNAVRPSAEGGGFRWELLVDAANPQGHPTAADAPADASRIDTQYWTANVNPTDRYALSLPGSTIYRLSPLDRSFDNLTIAGDWTASSLDTGCIESAVISGRLAAHAIAQQPPLNAIVGYDHP
jgi:uncharacterized protein with NAD-binding domain and iron-sulfur cluster